MSCAITLFLLNKNPQTHIGGVEFGRAKLLPGELRVEQEMFRHKHNINNGCALQFMRLLF